VSQTRGVGLVGRAVLGLSWMVAAALLVKGHAGTGDGFSAGLTAAIGTLTFQMSVGWQHREGLAVVRQGRRIAGVGLFLVLVPVFGPLLIGRPLLSHVPRPGVEPIAAGALQLTTALFLELGIFAVVLGMVLHGFDLLGSFSEEEEGLS
jgi:multicomponent Na+:H+ antiporter subunit B